MDDLNVIWPIPGRYVVAVSGGADSMVLLDVMARSATQHNYELSVAHFDHGLRTDSAIDEQFVESAAALYSLPYDHHEGKLGHASEASARATRHAWLEEVRVHRRADAILTAHHQDDLLETSLLNLARGSGRLGLAPMRTRIILKRPLIDLSRVDLRTYAAQHKIFWREDPTNADITNARNLLRHNLLSAASPAWRASYLENIAKLATLNTKIDQSISVIIDSAQQNTQTYRFSVSFLRSLQRAVLEELIVGTARKLHPGIALDRPLVTIAATFVHTATTGKIRPLRVGVQMHCANGYIIVTTKTPE
jgi:tRNA(Ile)-lysidine synthetase-like protein